MKAVFFYFLVVFSLFAFASQPIKPTHLFETLPRVPIGDVLARVDTNFGSFFLDLHKKKKPQAVEFFLANVQLGVYTDTIFHRIIDGFILQGGFYDIQFLPKKEHITYLNRSTHGTLSNAMGTIAFAGQSGDPDSAFTQFFINLNDNPNLDPTKNKKGYEVFGIVVSGMDVVHRLARVKIGQREGFHDAPFYPNETRIKQILILN